MDDLGQLYFGDVVKLQPFIKIVSKLRPQDKAGTLGCTMPAWFDRRCRWHSQESLTPKKQSKVLSMKGQFRLNLHNTYREFILTIAV